MAKPPTRGFESPSEHEARLLREGWYDNRPPQQRAEAMKIAREAKQKARSVYTFNVLDIFITGLIGFMLGSIVTAILG